MYLAYFFSKSAFNLLLIFISDVPVTDPSLEWFLNNQVCVNHFLTSVCVRDDFTAGGSSFSISPAGGTSSLCVKSSSSTSGNTSLSLWAVVTRVTFVVCIVKMLVCEEPCFLLVHGEFLCENDAITQEPARDIFQSLLSHYPCLK